MVVHDSGASDAHLIDTRPVSAPNALVSAGPEDTLEGGRPERPRFLGRPRVTWLAVAVLGTALVVATTAAVVYRHRAQDVPPPAAPAARPAPVPTTAPPLVQKETHTVLGGRLKIDLLTVRTGDGTGPDRLSVTAVLTGGEPGVLYRLTGGDCTAGRDRASPWAAGRADAAGDAALRGRIWMVLPQHSYYMLLEPWPFKFPHTPVTGLNGNLLPGGVFPLRVAHEPCL